MLCLDQYNALYSGILPGSFYDAINHQKTASIGDVKIDISAHELQNAATEFESNKLDIPQVEVERRAPIVAGKMSQLPVSQQVNAYEASKAHLLQVLQSASTLQSIEGSTKGQCTACCAIPQANSAAIEAQESVVCEAVQHMLLRPLSSFLSPSSAHSSTRPSSVMPIAPQIFRRNDGTFNLIRAVPPIENLILPGGGAKGIGLAGALMEMHNSGMLSGLRSVAGSSAGALVATWLSVGRSLPELGGLLGGNFRNLLETNEKLHPLYPDLIFKSTAAITAKLLSPFGAGHDTAIGMVKKLDEVTSEAVRDYLNSQTPAVWASSVKDMVKLEIKDKISKGEISADPSETSEALKKKTKYIIDRFCTLQAPADFSKSRQGKMVTFEDMAFLHALAPDKFKSLRITGYDLATQGHVIFDENIAPTLPVAYAARASMAHPLIATGVSFPSYQWKGANHIFSDGGISSNVPVEALVPLKAPTTTDSALPTPAYQHLRAATAVIAFDDDGTPIQAMNHSPQKEWESRSIFSRVKDSVVYGLMGWVAENPEIAKDNLADLQKIHDFGVNTLVVKHGDIGSLDLDVSCKRKANAIMLARTHLHEQLKIARGDSYAVEVGSIEEAFDMLDPAEKASLLASQSTARSAQMSLLPQDKLLMLANNEKTKRDAGQILLRI